MMKMHMFLITALCSFLLCVSCDDGGGSAAVTGTVTYAIGDTGPGGGIVFYITDGGEHGLEAAPADTSTGIRWNNGHNTVTAASAVVAGYGDVNTGTIIAAQGAAETSYAAGLACAYSGGGFSDWFLPTRDELNLMYVNLKCAAVPLGNFANGYYWSSSEYDSGLAWFVDFSAGSMSGESKCSALRVRAVREF